MSASQSTSPFDNLNNELSAKNYQFSNLLERLRTALHKISNTVEPKAEVLNKEPEPDLPFRDGHLKNYYFDLNRYNYILMELENEVLKIEGLV